VKPWTKAPISAGSPTYVGSLSFVTSVFNAIPSNGRLLNLAVFYIIAVKKDIGLNIPEIQSDLGGVISSEYSSSC